MLAALPDSIGNVFINLLGGTSCCMRQCLPFPLDTCHLAVDGWRLVPQDNAADAGGNRKENTFHNFSTYFCQINFHRTPHRMDGNGDGDGVFVFVFDCYAICHLICVFAG